MKYENIYWFDILKNINEYFQMMDLIDLQDT